MLKGILDKALVPKLIPVDSAVTIYNDIHINSVDDNLYYSFNNDILNYIEWHKIGLNESITLYDDVYLMHKSLEWQKVGYHLQFFLSDTTKPEVAVTLPLDEGIYLLKKDDYGNYSYVDGADAGSGDMLKAVYDVNDVGRVDDSTLVNGKEVELDILNSSISQLEAQDDWDNI